MTIRAALAVPGGLAWLRTFGDTRLMPHNLRRTYMFNQTQVTFEQAWGVISDIAKSCREFNELQFKYRQLALSVILAAYAAIGYFWANADKDTLPSTTSHSLTQPANSGEPKVIPANHPPRMQAGTTKSPATKPRGGTDVVKQARESAKANHSVALPGRESIDRLEWIFLGIGLISAFTSWVIWQIDGRYQLLLEANFSVAKKFEERLEKRAPPDSLALLHVAMEKAAPGSSVIRSMSIYYALAAFAGMLPWYAYSRMDQNTTVTIASLLGIADNRFGLIVSVVLVGLFTLSYFVGFRRNLSPAKQQGPRQPTTTLRAHDSTRTFDERLLTEASLAFEHAYCEYSEFAVGAAVLARNKEGMKRVFAGCNVENASYGLTLCAERNAIAAAVAADYRVIEQVLVYTENVVPTPPCGACRQVIHELGPQARVCLATPNGEKHFDIEELLPHPFGKT